MKLPRDLSGGEVARAWLALGRTPAMILPPSGSTLVVVFYRDSVGIAACEPEGEPPARIHGHRTRSGRVSVGESDG